MLVYINLFATSKYFCTFPSGVCKNNTHGVCTVYWTYLKIKTHEKCKLKHCIFLVGDGRCEQKCGMFSSKYILDHDVI